MATPLPRWVADVAAIVRASGDRLDWERLVAHARSLALVTPVREALTYAIGIVDLPIPEAALDRLDDASVSRDDERGYAIRCRPPSANPLRRIVLEYHRMSKRLSESGKRPSFVAFLSYVQALWGVDHAWQLPLLAVRWGARSLRRCLVQLVRSAIGGISRRE
jgi:hypothetical protein